MKRIGLLLLAVVMVAGVTACTDDPPSIETTVLPPGTVGTWYNFAIEARERGLYWYVEKGSLPPDLKLGVNDGRITGYPRTVGTYPARICAHEIILGNDQKDCQDFTLTINAAPIPENK